MEMRAFGRTGLRVPALGFGAGHIGSEQLSEREVSFVLGTALEMGLHFIDTAIGYGRSEERIGRHLGHRREEVILSTKVGYGVPGVPDWTAMSVERGVQQSLRRLRTDYLDVIHLHSCPRAVLRESGVVEALCSARSRGLTRLIAYSGEGQDLDTALSLGVFDSIQVSVNLFEQRVLTGAATYAWAHGRGVIAKRPLANAPWRYANRPTDHYCEAYWLRMRAMNLQPGPEGWLSTAIRFLLSQPLVHCSIVGSAQPQHLRAVSRAAEAGPLSQQEQDLWRAAFRSHDEGWVGQL